MLPKLGRDVYIPESVLRRRRAISAVASSFTTVANIYQRRGGISTDQDNRLFLRIQAPAGVEGNAGFRGRRISQSDGFLLDLLDTRQHRPLRTGRFLTLHKRRRKRLTTRSLDADIALLDDIHHGQVHRVLTNVHQWPFNAFTLDNVAGGRSLPVLCVHLFHWYGLVQYFDLDPVTCWKLFSLIEEGYHSSNPYHNAVHATDVTQAMHCFLQRLKIRQYLTPLEIMAALIAAVTHDLDHPGVNQPFLIATSNHLAALYQNTSVLENHHWRSAIGCLLESRLVSHMQEGQVELQEQISSLILATDITRQQEFLVKFKRCQDSDQLDMTRPEDRHFILQIALKCADISNPCRPWEVSKTWSQRVCDEFFRQGDCERQLRLPVTALCDRLTTSVPKIQAGFFKFVVEPLFDEWHRFLNDDLSHELIRNLKDNRVQWEALIAEQEAQIVNAEARADGSSMEGKCLEVPGNSGRVGRRHSMPLSVPSYLSVPVPRTTIRRESLAMGERRTVKFDSAFLEEGEDYSSLCRSSLSLVSSASPQDDSSWQGDKPVSMETLIPESSIASITTFPSVSRGFLTRQQTFPPLQPFRQRQMSTCSEVLRESSKQLRERLDEGLREKSSSDPLSVKIIKLDETSKENRRPRDHLYFSSSAPAPSRRPTNQGSLRRRGSAPDDATFPPARWRRRRGSVPLDHTLQSNQKELTTEGWRRLAELNLLTVGPPSRARASKKFARRKSSGDPEVANQRSEQDGMNEVVRWSLPRCLPPNHNSSLLQRRGSLPFDALMVASGCDSWTFSTS